MKDLFEEIFLTIRANKQRTFLTGFSIAWGIFMLIILLGAGNGLQNGMMQGFNYMSKNSMSIHPGVTSMPYKGLQKGRRLQLKQNDADFLKTHLKNIAEFSAVYQKWSISLIRGKDVVSTSMSGVEPGYEVMRNLIISSGRFVNNTDNRESRKVIVIHSKTAGVLFPNENSIGQYVQINQVPFQIVGIYEEEGGGGNRQPEVYIPLNTAYTIFNPDKNVSNISFTVTGVNNSKESEIYTKEVRQLLAQRLQFDPEDTNALWIHDNLSSYMQAQTIFNGIALFVWIIGIGTLIAGIVGVSNIMLITVKERTHEFGIRKALGATPRSILRLVVVESLTITTMFGYIGLLLGIGLTEGVASILAKTGQAATDKPEIFVNPTVDLGVVLAATAILILAGAIAGYIPAKRAVNVKPIEALQHK